MPWQGQPRRPNLTQPWVSIHSPENRIPLNGPQVPGLRVTEQGVCSSSTTHCHLEVGSQFLICKMGAMTAPPQRSEGNASGAQHHAWHTASP